MPETRAKPPLVIALTGPFGSGVTTVSKALEDMSFHRVSLSELMKRQLDAQEAAQQAQTQSLATRQERRRKLQDIGNEGRRSSPTFWIEKALEGVDRSKPLVIDAVRNPGEIRGMRDTFTNSLVIAVVASKDVRWRRVQADYDGNFKLFERDDQRDTEDDEKFGQHVQKCVDDADYVFVNEEDHGSSANRVAWIKSRLGAEIEFVRGEGTRRPTQAETHMACAYAQSHNSACLKRHVGAVIVDVGGRPLSMGYNENPYNLQPCVREYGYCFKDNNMEVKLEQMAGVYCPTCGTKHLKLEKPYKCISCGENLKYRLFSSRNVELCTAIHAEEQAIDSLRGRSAEGATIFVTTFPCFQCAHRILDAGIKRLVYVEAYPIKESQELLSRGKVAVEPFQGFKARYFNLIFKQVE